MTRELTNEKTAVFAFGDLDIAEEPRSYDLDEPTRELPLIAGRFAGREWTAEKLQSAPAVPKTERGDKAFHRTVGLAAAAMAAVALMVGSLMGQAKLVDLNEQAVTASTEIAALRTEQNNLLLRLEESNPAADLNSIPESLESRVLDEMLTAGVGNTGEDKATVLNIRHGRELGYLWESFVDRLGESFR